MTPIEQVKTWVERDLSRWSKLADFVDDAGEDRIRIYTDKNSYAIYAKDGYLGCMASARKPRAGEDWTRGNDLPDGPLSEETWRRILCDIVSYELVRIHRREEPKHVPVIDETVSPATTS